MFLLKMLWCFFRRLRPRHAYLLQANVPLPPGHPYNFDIEAMLGRNRQLIKEKVIRASTGALGRKRALRLLASAKLPPLVRPSRNVLVL